MAALEPDAFPADDEQLNALMQRLAESGALHPCVGSDGTSDGVTGKVHRRRGHAQITFVDVMAGAERLQVVVQRNELQGAFAPGTPRSLTLPLLTRPSTEMLAIGRRGCTRRGELSLFASSFELRSLPCDPATLSRAATLVACGALALEEAAAALAAGARARSGKKNAEADETIGQAAFSGLQAQMPLPVFFLMSS